MEAPCKMCDRKGCGDYHDVCEKYKEFRKQCNELSKKRLLKDATRVPSRKYHTRENSVIKCHKK